MFSSPSWGSVARFDMPLQLSRLNTIYLDDYLKVTGEQIWASLFAGLSKGGPNIAVFAKHCVVVGMHLTRNAHIFIHDIT